MARYRRGDFLIDAEWLGLDARSGLSEPELRRRRDELMHQHHPDRGGSAEMAGRINETYARMSGWLRRRKQISEASRRARSGGEGEHPKSERVAANRLKVAGKVLTTAIGAAAATWAIVRARKR